MHIKEHRFVVRSFIIIAIVMMIILFVLSFYFVA